MANITITSGVSTVTANFGDYSNTIGFKSHSTRKFNVSAIQKENGSVEFYLNRWGLLVSFNGANGTMIVDSVNGVAPISNADLLSKLSDLME